MIAAADINISKIEKSKLNDINLENIPFGKYFTDHMLEVDYEDGEWKTPEIPSSRTRPSDCVHQANQSLTRHGETATQMAKLTHPYIQRVTKYLHGLGCHRWTFKTTSATRHSTMANPRTAK